MLISPRGTEDGAAPPSLGRELLTACRRVVVPFVLVGAVTVLLGLLITRVLERSWFGREDAAFDRTLAQHRTPTGKTLTHLGTLFAETPTIVVLTAVTAIIFRLVYHRWRESIFLVLCVAGQSLIFLATTLLIDRKRPPVSHLDASPPTSSFPSGHTAAATAFYGGVAIVLAWHTRHRWLKVLVTVLGVLAPIVVASCRLYRGMHYPSDAAVSFLMALSLLAITGRLFLFARPSPSTAGAGPDGADARAPAATRRRLS